MMKTGAVVTTVVAILALCGVVAAFSTNSSPYVTILEARHTSGDRLHVEGDIDKSSVHEDSLRHQLTFDIHDKTGSLHVVHVGELPANMSEANKVVAIGGMKGNDFVSQQLLIKCPSKYEAGTPGASDGAASGAGYSATPTATQPSPESPAQRA
jgi:cytochrome c-type biogenesis protein CcmE